MKANLLILSLFFSFSLFAQNDYWKTSYGPVDTEVIPDDRIPKTYKTFEIDLDFVNNLLIDAPDSKSRTASNVSFQIPDQNGDFLNFKVYKSATLPQELKDLSGIQTYSGYSQNGDIASIVTSMWGIHIGVLRPGLPDLVLQTSTRDLQNVIVYTKNQLQPVEFECYTDAENLNLDLDKDNIQRINDELLRTYRFAVGTTGEYSQYHVNRAINLGIINNNATDAEKKNVVLAAVTVTIDRLNSVYVRDFGVMLELVPNELDVIFLDPNNDPYDNSDIMSMLNGNTNVLNNYIGFNNYDGGHLFTTYPGGGISGLGIICTGQKGRSVTGAVHPINDAYDIDYVAHEVGHAFGCNHTFGNSCQNNRNLSTSVEPGSGSTIMAYAGVCGPNIQLHSDDYFHAISITEVNNFVTGVATCSIDTNIGNNAPVITVVNYGNVHIPKSTPFMLQAFAVDQNQGDALTYCWEQIDAVNNGNIQTWVPNPTHTGGPEFRSYDPETTGVRFFPKMVNIINNTYGNSWEKLSSVNRTMTFSITVRDNHPGGGQTPADFVQFNVDQTTGPFRITNMANAETWQAGQTKTITWNVAGTTGGQVNCATVDLLFSADNGLTFPYVVATNIPNNGSATFTVPGVQDTQLGRFMIKAHDNYFFDVAHGRFTIQGSGSVVENNISNLQIYPNPAQNKVNISFDVDDNKSPVSIQLFDISGRQVWDNIYEASQSFNKLVDFGNLVRGIYVIKINNGKFAAAQKLILN